MINKFSLGKIGLVIQGPLLSVGRDGAGNQVSFDCTENIIEIHQKFGQFFDEILVSTWENENVDLVKKLLDCGVEVKQFQDPKNNQEKKLLNDNRIRQFVSSKLGVDALRSDIEWACKIRTDQSFNLNEFLEDFVVTHNSYCDYSTVGERSFLQALAFYSSSPYAACDFAYMGHREVITNFFEVQIELNYLPFTEDDDWPEGDSVRKYLFSKKSNFPGIPERNFFSAIPKDLNFLKQPIGRLRAPASTILLWQSMLTAYLSFSTERTANSLIWRGNRFEWDDRSAFQNEWLQARISYINFLNEISSPLLRGYSPTNFWVLKERILQIKSPFSKLAKLIALNRRIVRILSKITSLLNNSQT